MLYGYKLCKVTEKNANGMSFSIKMYFLCSEAHPCGTKNRQYCKVSHASPQPMARLGASCSLAVRYSVFFPPDYRTYVHGLPKLCSWPAEAMFVACRRYVRGLPKLCPLLAVVMSVCNSKD